jgi:hypothetical protein
MNPPPSEFQRISPNSLMSSEGFTVTWLPAGGVDYSDATGTVRVDSESLLKPSRILVYPHSDGLKALAEHRAEEILTNVVRALEYLGHEVERW